MCAGTAVNCALCNFLCCRSSLCCDAGPQHGLGAVMGANRTVFLLDSAVSKVEEAGGLELLEGQPLAREDAQVPEDDHYEEEDE